MGEKIVITPSSFGKVTSDAMDLLKQNFSELKINDTSKKSQILK